MAQKVILHLRFDSFFTTIEQQANPLLKNMPVGITKSIGSNELISVNSEARKLGINEQCSVSEALIICPNFIAIPANLNKYLTISERIISICDELTHFVELASINEIYMDISHMVKTNNDMKIIKKWKKNLIDKIGDSVNLNIGISYNKLLAKIASGSMKEKGTSIGEINHVNIWQIYQQTPVTQIPNLDILTIQKLQDFNINTLLDLRDIPYEKLISEFGIVEGTHLKNIGLGIDFSRVIPYTKVLPKTYDSISWLMFPKEVIKEYRRLGIEIFHIGKYASRKLYFDKTRNIFQNFRRFVNLASHVYHLSINKFQSLHINEGNRNKNLRILHTLNPKNKDISRISDRLAAHRKFNQLTHIQMRPHQ